MRTEFCKHERLSSTSHNLHRVTRYTACVNRNFIIVLGVIVVFALAFMWLSPRSTSSGTTSPVPQPASLPTTTEPNSSEPGTTPENPATATDTGGAPISPQVVSFEGQPRTLEGALDLELSGERLRLAALVNSQRVADVPIQDGRFKLELPGTLENTPMNKLSDLPLPNGDGRLQADPDVLGARVLLFAYEDSNDNNRLDEGEPSAEGTLSLANQDPNMRGFFRTQLYLLSGPAQLKDTQDSPTGAKGYFRYDLDLSAGWNIIQGEFGSNGYDIRAASGDAWDVSTPLTPRQPGPGGFEPR